jgi:hypothetical protein
MPTLTRCAKNALPLVALLLGACATTVSVSDLSLPNFGYQKLPHFDAFTDPDPRAVANGLYAVRPLQYGCAWCTSQPPLYWSGWSP